MKIEAADKEQNNFRQENGGLNLSMQVRLFVYIIIFTFVIASGVFIILILTGKLRTGENIAQIAFKSELERISNDIYSDFGNISVQGVEFSKSLSISLENKMNELGIDVHNFKNHPEYLEKLLEGQFEKLINSLEKSKTTGVFLILDATVNENLHDSGYSRSGLYIKNMEANTANNHFSNYKILHGPISLSQKNNINIVPQWKMEINTKDAPYFTYVMDNAKKSKLSLSRMYYWTEPVHFKNDSGDLMLCIVPLISKDNTVFGICGFEVNSMLFKLSYSPNNSNYNYLFTMLSKLENNYMNTKTAFLAGSYIHDYSNFTSESLSINTNGKFLNNYKQIYGKENYIGTHKTISLYPSNSIYKNEKYAVSILIPEKSFNLIFSNQNSTLIFYFGILLILSVIIAYIISEKNMKPVTDTLDLLKIMAPSEIPRVNISEIDDLIEFLSKQDEEEKEKEKIPVIFEIQENGNSLLFTEFIKNTELLSTAEKSVFNLYLKGHTAKEIADILCLSINTIKTHNKRIYMKLNVSSRKELMVYIKMMEEKGMIEKIERLI